VYISPRDAINMFQSTPLREGRPVIVMVKRSVHQFQSTPLREGRLSSTTTIKAFSAGFNPRPCARGDHVHYYGFCGDAVSIHAPARGATRVRIAIVILCLFQSTPLREGRPEPGIQSIRKPMVSIHAPARGATGGRTCRYSLWRVSIHAPARGATSSRLRMKC